MADLAGLRTYAVEGDLTDADYQLALDAAKGYLANGGVTEREDDALYDLGVYRLATYYLDNRAPGGDVSHVPYGIQGIILQLRAEVT